MKKLPWLFFDFPAVSAATSLDRPEVSMKGTMPHSGSTGALALNCEVELQARDGERLVMEVEWRTGDVTVFALPIAYAEPIRDSRVWRAVLRARRLSGEQVSVLCSAARSHAAEVRQAVGSDDVLSANPMASAALRRLAAVVAYEPWGDHPGTSERA